MTRPCRRTLSFGGPRQPCQRLPTLCEAHPALAYFKAFCLLSPQPGPARQLQIGGRTSARLLLRDHAQRTGGPRPCTTHVRRFCRHHKIERANIGSGAMTSARASADVTTRPSRKSAGGSAVERSRLPHEGGQCDSLSAEAFWKPPWWRWVPSSGEYRGPITETPQNTRPARWTARERDQRVPRSRTKNPSLR